MYFVTERDTSDEVGYPGVYRRISQFLRLTLRIKSIKVVSIFIDNRMVKKYFIRSTKVACYGGRMSSGSYM